jgi:hypothetical protein
MSNIDNSGFKVFMSLQNRKQSNPGYILVESVPYSVHHKIGISNDGFPLFFVKCDIETKSIDINLEFISVMFSQVCSIKEKEKNSDDVFTIVLLKTFNRDLQNYFTDVFSIILQQLEPVPSEINLQREIRKVIDLFSSISKPPLKSVQGLWAELLVIEKARAPEYLIYAWHISPSDKYDFNDSKDKLEIKSTSKSNRIHRFSLEQLNTNQSSQLLIGSTFVIETGSGKSILNLRDNIISKLSDFKVILRLNEIIFNTIGNEYDKLGDIFFDYQKASDTLLFYNVLDMPSIDIDSIPSQISNVTFDCDLTNVPTISETECDLSNSLLFQSLGR